MNKSTLLEELYAVERQLERILKQFSDYLEPVLRKSQFDKAPELIDEISEK